MYTLGGENTLISLGDIKPEKQRDVEYEGGGSAFLCNEEICGLVLNA